MLYDPLGPRSGGANARGPRGYRSAKTYVSSSNSSRAVVNKWTSSISLQEQGAAARRQQRAQHAPDVLEVHPALFPGVDLAVAARIGAADALERGVVAAAVDDAGRKIDEAVVARVHPVVHPGLEDVEVPFAAHVVRLHVVQPVEEAREPAQLRVLGLADRTRVGAKVDVGEEGILAALRCLLARKVVELAKVAHAGRLDGAATPPAAPLHVGTRFAAYVQLGQGGVLAAARAAPPRAGTLVVLVEAAGSVQQAGIARALVDGANHVRRVVGRAGQHLWRHACGGRRRAKVDTAARHAIERRRPLFGLVPAGPLGGAPSRHVPPGRLGNRRPWRAEEGRRRAVPLRRRSRHHHHVGVDGALDLLGRDGLARLGVEHAAGGAAVALVALAELAARRRGGVDLARRAALGAHHVKGALLAPVVLVAGVVLDRLLHRLRQEGGEVGEADGVLARAGGAGDEGAPRHTARGHLLERADHVGPKVLLAVLPASARR
mmetsp:Transcript_1692/g.5587  ORF Transcript_1692/g.5587 Transcript_1692/m.5587 type:complete len:491 (-) Transcript_1692:212-1684(-)